MKIRTAIVALALLAGGAATTFAGERRPADIRDHGDRDHREVVVRHDDRDDIRHDDRDDIRHDDRDAIRRDRDFGHDHVLQYDPGCRIVLDR